MSIVMRPFPRLTPVQAGEALLVVSALAFSTAGLFTHVIPVDLPALIVWRNLFGGAALLPFVLLGRDGRAWRSLGGLGARGWSTIATSALATLCFLAALRTTTVADVSIIYASAPLVTALVAWIVLGERPGRRTVLAAALACAGVITAAAGASGRGALGGDGLALAMTVAMSAMTVLARRGGRSPALLLSSLSAILAAVAALPLVWGAGASLAISWAEAAGLALFGLVTMAVALPCYVIGAARVPAARAMLISASEMPFAPLWVWLALGEAPPPATLAGGVLVALAILWDLAGARRDATVKKSTMLINVLNQ